MRKQLTALTIATATALSLGAGVGLASNGGHSHGKSDRVSASERSTRDTSRDRKSGVGEAEHRGLDRISRDAAGAPDR